MEKKDYFAKQQHLPDWMRDFHDQKQVFKTIFQHLASDKDRHPVFDNISWRDAQEFTIDIFLW